MTPVFEIRATSFILDVLLTNDAVPEPVGGGRDGNTLGTNWKLENLSDDDPACRTPGAGKLSANVTTVTVPGCKLTMQRRR